MSDDGTVEIESCAGGIVVVVLSGEHDAGSRSDLAQPLRVRGSRGLVLVDLTDCTFLDSAIIGTILHHAGEFQASGGRLELIAPRSATLIARTLEAMRVRKLLRVHESRADAITSMRTTLPYRLHAVKPAA